LTDLLEEVVVACLAGSPEHDDRVSLPGNE
jgi:hypothetical protein